MIVRAVNLCEKSVTSLPTTPIVVPANTSTVVLQTIRNNNAEYAGRYIQNVGNAPCYYAFDADASSVQFNGILQGSPTYQQLDVSNFSGVVKVFSASGTTIAVTLLVRNDNAQGSGGIINGTGQMNNI
jgi:hypothetical protein